MQGMNGGNANSYSFGLEPVSHVCPMIGWTFHGTGKQRLDLPAHSRNDDGRRKEDHTRE
jgi:hypothetical protein